MSEPIYVVSGAPGAGRAEVATALMERVPLGLHVPVAAIQDWVCGGHARTAGKKSNEPARQLRLARWAALQAATIYAEAGFAVAFSDALDEPTFQRQYQQLLHGYAIHKVMLAPPLAALLAQRAAALGKRKLPKAEAAPLEQLHTELVVQNQAGSGWMVLDPLALGIDETVSQILANSS